VYVHIGGANSHDKPLFRLRHFVSFRAKSVQKHRLHSAHSAQTQNGALLPRAVSNSILAHVAFSSEATCSQRRPLRRGASVFGIPVSACVFPPIRLK
jgi:hypothetical protein